ncbi:hypothetical protein K490DRAFT_49000 [Saccharata proteae CBS 121410]|uniref:F-box domain-containing protein n=1 Tax=Saccharata proteae CBS 121410 TaxID=1314787 RepID=A0A9P4HRY7_9PEZI|nr:hypothetical protein K490DRAFT_49000 [Saccharata proteae CBS 121410]
MEATSISDTRPKDDHNAKEVISKLLNGKEKEWTAVVEKRGPLGLLDLPVDILKGIIDHLPHTNDLTSLALCHSALHALTIPQIYSRFDIVWPERANTAEPRTGVDALTYGLATLVMGEEIFGEAPIQREYWRQKNAAKASSSNDLSIAHQRKQEEYFPLPQRRRGNHFAQYTKKFSLGNGPADWVQEYLITKEGGKMLGTLVAIAVARMRSLETFVWDMPTGVLRDVWLALSSLADRGDGQECRLERLWIRWHDNSAADPSTPLVPPPVQISNVQQMQHATHASGAGGAQASIVIQPAIQSHATPSAVDRVEHPTFSVIPALKSLSVMDIDELPYLDEMAILIGRSQKKLRELRVGIARHAHDQERDWVNAWSGEGVQQVDYSTTWTAHSKIGDKRLGGVLGILVGRVYNMRRNFETWMRSKGMGSTIDLPVASGALPAKSEEAGGSAEEARDDNELDAESWSESATPVPGYYRRLAEQLRKDYPDGSRDAEINRLLRRRPPIGPMLNTKLKLEILELERVPLSVRVMLDAFDWRVLTTLTLLHCNNHEQLWKSLRRTYTPRSVSSSNPTSPNGKHRRNSLGNRYEYCLNLKKIHTNAVSPSLISFLKETLAPNSLEVLFLQEDRSYHSSVTVDAIYRGPLRRHRASMKKLMIDSSEKSIDDHATNSTRWKRWKLSREIITFITSGRMSSLRELAVTIDYKDWHFFLQRLPQIPHLRSLYIPYIADHAHGNNVSPDELALQVVDIVTLRPDIELCYMGILTKCFEILENRSSTYEGGSTAAPPHDGSGGPGGGFGGLGMDEEDEDPDDEGEDEDGDGGGMEEDSESEGSEGSYDEFDDFGESDSEEGDGCGGPRLRLREILFYDDKVAIFKARHGRL